MVAYTNISTLRRVLTNRHRSPTHEEGSVGPLHDHRMAQLSLMNPQSIYNFESCFTAAHEYSGFVFLSNMG